ncbi:MAG: DUF1345 domain-containing protein [Sphingobium sp.]|jgi:uncharacterized membrane protein|nr:DUF1345 domain-containing protein [Sphingobium sp.]MCI1271702.1 DUF1345 domain-containing protein [Sphingobium sp.]MCI1756105.1 DUF1345 domain-containing protein [Sphingobium sp.]MCI2053574.1 DUF1345 domain-containing protein [Sphingobium sp.]
MQRPKTFSLPWRYGVFLLVCVVSAPLAWVFPWQTVIMAGFDLAALVFIATLPPLYRHDPKTMRKSARENDANREITLLITFVVMVAILVTVAMELHHKHTPNPAYLVLILMTLSLAWLFSNIVYALHYAYLFYSSDAGSADRQGIDFPKENLPDYWDFTYFSFTLGMTFQTSDVAISSRTVRKIVLFHSLAAFVFNLGILAFTINVLGG